jgi:hypothetical protein
MIHSFQALPTVSHLVPKDVVLDNVIAYLKRNFRVLGRIKLVNMNYTQQH